MSSFVQCIKGRELIDSRGWPALEVEVTSTQGFTARAMVPSGASTGKFEAYELRDKDSRRFYGKGLLKACDNVSKLSKELKGFSLDSLEDIDQKLIDRDGSSNKKNFGANTVLAISLTCLKLQALIKKKPLYSFFKNSKKLPIPLINVMNGGIHANNNLDVQEFMIVPHGFSSLKRALRSACEIFQTLRKNLEKKKLSSSVGDEGGFAPSLKSNEEALDFLLDSIEKAGYQPGKEVSLALDVAASSFYQEGFYFWEGKKVSSQNLLSIYERWAEKYPVISIEDGLEEENWEDWKTWTLQQGDKIQIVGDDLFVTHPDRLKKGIKEKSANAILIKLNQIGTVSEARQTMNMAQESGFKCIMSHRSGETEDTSIADLALAFGCSQIKTGGMSRSERTAKYNQLLRIEEELGEEAQYQKW